MHKSFQSKRKRVIIHAFEEMQAERAHYCTYVALTKINLPYVVKETGLEEDRIFNGENLLHFIGALLYKLNYPFLFPWPGVFTAIVRGMLSDLPLTWVNGRYKTMDWNS